MIMKDIIFTGDFYYDYSGKEDDIIKIFEKLEGEKNSLIVNLEGPLSKSGEKIRKRGPNLCQSSAAIEILKAANVTGVCLANNHILDYGEDALYETLQMLDEAGIQHTGAGRNLAEARTPIRISDGNHLYAIYNYGWEIEEVVRARENTPGCAPREEKIILEDIRDCLKKHEIPIIVMHWGFEYNLNPQPRDIALAHKMIDEGAGLVIGHHPHVIQGMESYHGKEIYYSLGNFYFSGMRNRFMKKFDTELVYEGKYGIVVRYNGAADESTWETICYDPDAGKSVLLEKRQYPMSDYTNQKCDFKYRKKLRKEKENINPILYDNPFAKIKTVFFQIIFRKVLRSIKKAVIG